VRVGIFHEPFLRFVLASIGDSWSKKRNADSEDSFQSHPWMTRCTLGDPVLSPGENPAPTYAIKFVLTGIELGGEMYNQRPYRSRIGGLRQMRGVGRYTHCCF